jgi:phage tail P2-like protein
MNNSLFDVDFTRMLPPPLKTDEAMLTLAKTIAAELQNTAHLSRRNIIYANFDELPESLVDILAYDFHVDWYEYDYPLDAKRQLVKDSVRAHKRLGTVYAIKTAIGSVYPNTEIEEWFQYDGEPFHFRIILDVTHSKATAQYSQIIRTLQHYKRLSAHLDYLTYECQIHIGIQLNVQGYKFPYGLTNTYNAGTRPQTNIVGASVSDNIIIKPGETIGRFTYERSGTKPQVNIPFSQDELAVQDGITASPFEFPYGLTDTERKSGTKPNTNVAGAVDTASVNASINGAGYTYTTERSGTKPQTNTPFQASELDVVGAVKGVGYEFPYITAGTRPQANTTLTEGGITVKDSLTAQAFKALYQTPGAAKVYDVPGGEQDGGGLPLIAMEAFGLTYTFAGTKNCGE